MELLERGEVLQDLDSHLEQAVRGLGRLVLLHGEAGIGKTTVVGRLADRARAAMRTAIGECDPLTTPSPLGPLLDVAPALSDELDEGLRAALAGRDSPSAVFRGLLTELAHRPTLLVFEDVHWADEATLDLLRYLARRISATSALVVITYRDEEIGPAHPLTVLLGDIAAYPPVHRRALAPLSRPAVAHLAAGHGLELEEVYRITGGNPFFITEILAAGGNGIPATVREAVLGRLARLSVSAREVARAVAVLGPRTTPELITVVVPGAEAALEECLAGGMLRADGPTVAFRHELARMAVLESIPAYRRIELHARVLAAMRSRPIAPGDVARLAEHAEAAGDTAAVLEYASAATALAIALRSHREAAAHYDRILRHGAALSPRRRAAVLEARASEYFWSNRTDEAIASCQTALQLRRGQQDRFHEGVNLGLLSLILRVAAGQTSQARQLGVEALRLLEPYGPSHQLALTYLNLTDQACFDQDCEAATGYARQAVLLGEQFDAPAITAWACGLAAAARLVCTGTGWAELEEAQRYALDSGQEEQAVLIAVWLCYIALLHRDLPRAFAAADYAEAYCLDHDLMGYALTFQGLRAIGLLCNGQWNEAESLARRVLDHPCPLLQARLAALLVLGLLHARRGEPGVWDALDEAITLVEDSELLRLCLVWEARAEAAWLAGDDVRAGAEAHRGLAAAAGRSAPWLLGGLVRWIRRAGDTPPAVPVAEVYALELAGDWEGAAVAWERLGYPYEAALARLNGDASGLRQALATVESLGAAPAAARIRARMRAVGMNPATPGPHGPHAATLANPYRLTNRELEVLLLLRERLSDAEIADRLVLSRKTVSHHVSAILTKLGVTTRREAARKLGQ